MSSTSVTEPDIQSVTAEFEVYRWHGAGTGCHGNASLERTDTTRNYRTPGVYPDEMLGRDLPEGTRIRVTIEVLEEGDQGFGHPAPSHFWTSNDGQHTPTCSGPNRSRA